RALPAALSAYAHDHSGMYPAPKSLTGDPATDALLKDGYLPEYFENPLAHGTRVHCQPLAEQSPGNFTYVSEVLPPSYMVVVLKGPDMASISYPALVAEPMTKPWLLRTDDPESSSDLLLRKLLRAAADASMDYDDTRVFNHEALEFHLLHELPPGLPPTMYAISRDIDITATAELAGRTLDAQIFHAGHPDTILFRFTLPNFRNFHERYSHWALVEQGMANLHTIQIALERYATDQDGRYPADVSTLTALGYFKSGQAPANPFAPERSMAASIPVHLTAGDFVYVPLFSLETKNGDSPYGYFLGLVGPKGYREGAKINPQLVMWYMVGTSSMGSNPITLPNIRAWDDVLREYQRANSLQTPTTIAVRPVSFP
ncbi:MAG: hypothetical protein ACREJQ_01185, partial [bacterium]